MTVRTYRDLRVWQPGMERPQGHLHGERREESHEEGAQSVLPSVVELDVEGSQGAGSGSGIIIDSDGRILIGDALHHYVQLRSAVFDQDLHFQNEYVRLYGIEQPLPETEPDVDAEEAVA